MTERLTVEYAVILDPRAGTAGLLRLVSVLHARDAEVVSVTYGPDTDVVRALLAVRTRPGGASTLGQALRRMVHALEVVGPRELSSFPPPGVPPVR